MVQRGERRENRIGETRIKKRKMEKERREIRDTHTHTHLYWLPSGDINA